MNATIIFSIPVKGPGTTVSDTRTIVDNLADSFKKELEQKLRENNFLSSQSITVAIRFEDVPELRQAEFKFED